MCRCELTRNPPSLPTTIRLFGWHLATLPNALLIAKWRRITIYATGIELGFALSGLPLGLARRGGIGILSMVINLFLSALSLVGFYSCVYLRPYGIALHAAMVLGVIVVFIFIFFLMWLQNPENSSSAILLVIFIFCLVDVIVGLLTARFVVALHFCEDAVKRQGTPPVAPASAAPVNIAATSVQMTSLQTDHGGGGGGSGGGWRRPKQELKKQESWGLPEGMDSLFPDSYKWSVAGMSLRHHLNTCLNT